MNLRTMSSRLLLLSLAACAPAASTQQVVTTPGASATPPQALPPVVASAAAPAGSVSAASVAAPEVTTELAPCGSGAPCKEGPSYFAAIDLGTKGIKAFLFKLVQTDDGIYGQPVFHDDAITTLASAATSNRFTTQSISDAADAVTKLVKEMKDFAARQELDPAYYIVGSSGISAFANRDELKAAVDRASGRHMQFIDAATEGREGLLSAGQTSSLASMLHVDIGSGNTKIGCMVDGVYNAVDIPFGTVTLTQAVPTPGPFVAGLKAFMKDKIEPLYTAAERKAPCLEGRTFIYFIGGTPWAAATFTHPEDTYCRYVRITTHDLDDFKARLEKGTWRQAAPANLRQECAAEQGDTDPATDRQKVQDRFAQDNLIAGVSLMRLVLARGNPNATAIFFRNGNYIYGYALEHYKDIRYFVKK